MDVKPQMSRWHPGKSPNRIFASSYLRNEGIRTSSVFFFCSNDFAGLKFGPLSRDLRFCLMAWLKIMTQEIHSEMKEMLWMFRDEGNRWVCFPLRLREFWCFRYFSFLRNFGTLFFLENPSTNRLEGFQPTWKIDFRKSSSWNKWPRRKRKSASGFAWKS